jgi:hypothetical protein
VSTYVTRVDRFRSGDYPMVCARSGLQAGKLIEVEAARRATWPWLLLPIWWVGAAVSYWVVDGDRLVGKLPFAAGQFGRVSATWDKRTQLVTLRGVHPAFVAACREQQRRTADTHPA